MRITSLIAALGALLAVASASLARRVLNDPVEMYLDRMCIPLYINTTRTRDLNLSIAEMPASLANSPFPCEQEIYLEAVCLANGTTEDDFLAEQECLCNGGFFEAIAGCDACLDAHGSQEFSPQLQSSALASLSAAECEPSPPFQPYSNLVPRVNITSLSESPPMTLGDDRFPNNTAVSNYWTPTKSVTAGEITGSATARLTSWTDFAGNGYSPTSIPPNSGVTSTPSIATSLGSSTTATPTPSASGNVAAAKGVQAAGGLFAAAIGLAVLL